MCARIMHIFWILRDLSLGHLQNVTLLTEHAVNTVPKHDRRALQLQLMIYPQRTGPKIERRNLCIRIATSSTTINNVVARSRLPLYRGLIAGMGSFIIRALCPAYHYTQMERSATRLTTCLCLNSIS